MFLAAALTAGTAMLQIRLMQPLQRLYLEPFLRSSILPFALTVELVEVNGKGRGYVIAVDPWISVTREGNRTRFSLSDSAVAAGLASPRTYVAKDINPKGIRPFFDTSIFHGSALKTFRPTLISFFAFFAAGLLVGGWFDQQHREEVRRGIQIRGPKLMRPRKAQKYLTGDGIALFLEPKAR